MDVCFNITRHNSSLLLSLFELYLKYIISFTLFDLFSLTNFYVNYRISKQFSEKIEFKFEFYIKTSLNLANSTAFMQLVREILLINVIF